jgi:5-methyltetrahydrofolate--homocysteine methyltransferase
MEAIHAANFLTDNDPHGGKWIKFNKAPPKPGEDVLTGRGGRAASRRRRA